MMLFVNGKSIAYATSHTLTISGDTQDTSNKDEGGGNWSANEVSTLSWTAQSENMYSIDGAGSNFDDLFDIMVAKTPVTATFSKKTETAVDVPEGGWTASKPDYEGKVVITSLELNAPNGEYATYTVQFTGIGALQKVDK
nr:MAG TPA: tail tube protein [Caudoviricetes sp.]